MCVERGIPAAKYLAGFIAGFFLVLFVTSFVIVMVYGQNIINDPDVQSKVALFSPFAMMFHFLLFIFFRLKISRAKTPQPPNEDEPLPPSSEKKDLSYFR
jgi:hypothetical protein